MIEMEPSNITNWNDFFHPTTKAGETTAKHLSHDKKWMQVGQRPVTNPTANYEHYFPNLEYFFDYKGVDISLKLLQKSFGDVAYHLVQRCRETQTDAETFTFFWETATPFSQWYKSAFQGPSVLFAAQQNLASILNPETTQLEFSSAEQFMMYHKAVLFGDIDMAKAIIATQDPRTIKELGRQVKNFNDIIWTFFRSLIVYEGNKAKFTQNEVLKQALFATQGTTLVEASPYDQIWGIGLKANESKAQKRQTWEGKNLLGEILTQLRVDLMGKY